MASTHFGVGRFGVFISLPQGYKTVFSLILQGIQKINRIFRGYVLGPVYPQKACQPQAMT